MTIKIDRSDACKLMLACTALSQSLKRESIDENVTEDRRIKAASSAGMYDRLHDVLKESIEAWDAKHPVK